MEKNYYNINELAVISGFTTRSLRNFITMGHLNGEKIDGMWQFSAEEIDAFLSNPNVAPGIKSKANAVVYDFMADTEKKTNKICSVLDFVMDADEASEISKYFCNIMVAFPCCLAVRLLCRRLLLRSAERNFRCIFFQ